MRARTLTPLLFLGLAGCATIAGGGPSQTVHIESVPVAASYVIRSSSGLQAGAGRTPSAVRLPRRSNYSIEIALEGYRPQTMPILRCTNRWIWGNLMVGLVPGLIVDFATGSAYRLEPAMVSVSLVRSGADTFAVMRLFTERNRLIGEQQVRMVPIEE